MVVLALGLFGLLVLSGMYLFPLFLPSCFVATWCDAVRCGPGRWGMGGGEEGVREEEGGGKKETRSGLANGVGGVGGDRCR